jgi:hypothetical protein
MTVSGGTVGSDFSQPQLNKLMGGQLVHGIETTRMQHLLNGEGGLATTLKGESSSVVIQQMRNSVNDSNYV